MIEGHLRIPRWLGRLFKPFVIGNYWDTRLSDEVADMIDSSEYSMARFLIWLMESKDGTSENSVRLAVMIDRIEFLGEEKMKIKLYLVFEDWKDKDNKSVYNTEKGVDLSMGDFHSGTTFEAEIAIDEDSAAQLKQALKDGYTPVFYVSKHGVEK